MHEPGATGVATPFASLLFSYAVHVAGVRWFGRLQRSLSLHLHDSLSDRSAA
jgi:hypothetical protein